MPAVRGHEPEPCHSITGEVGTGHRAAPAARGTLRSGDTGHRFHVLSAVAGDGILPETGGGRGCEPACAAAPTVPAATGACRVRALGTGPVRYVKALAR
jgi:hypothetical protein